jgi:hypothetical protein
VSGRAGGTAPRGSTGRNVIWLAATTVILVLLLSYKTSTGGAPPAPPTQPPGVVDRPAGSPSPGASGQPDGLALVASGHFDEAFFGGDVVVVSWKTGVVIVVHHNGPVQAVGGRAVA